MGSIKGMVALLVAASCIAGCEPRRVATGPYLGAGVGTGDVDFVTKSYNVQHFDIDEGRLAATHSHNPQVQQLAAYLIDRGSYIRSQTKPIGDRLDIQPPDALDPALRTKLASTAALEGPAFDRAYVADQIDSHQWFLEHAQEAEIDTENPQLKAMLPPSIEQLKASLAHLHQVQAQLGGG